MKDRQGKPAKALLTVTCVNTNRLEHNNRLSFPAYYYTQAPYEPYKTEEIFTNSTLLSSRLGQPANAVPLRYFNGKGVHKPQINAGIVFARDGKKVKEQLAGFILLLQILQCQRAVCSL